MIKEPLSPEELEQNRLTREQLCVEAESLQESTQWRETADRLRDMQQEWKQLGPVSRDEAELLNQRFRSACDTFFENRTRNFQSQELERIDNLYRKTELCEMAEALEGSEDLQEAIEEVQRLFQEWKSIGPVPREKSDALWERFRKAQDALYQTRKLQFEEKDKDRQANHERRLQICAEAEAMKESVEWEVTTVKIKNLQADWKAAWPVPRDEGEKLWETFRQACDHFFERKRVHFEEKRREWQKNQAVWRMNMQKVIARKEEEITRLEAGLDYERNHIAEWEHRRDHLPAELKSIDMKFEIEEKIARAEAELERKTALIMQLHKEIAEISEKLEKG